MLSALSQVWPSAGVSEPLITTKEGSSLSEPATHISSCLWPARASLTTFSAPGLVLGLG